MEEKFKEQFGVEPTHSFFAPGRVNLIGEHTDYNGGHVFPCAITQGTYGYVRPREDKLVRCYSANFEEIGMIEWSLDDLSYDKQDNWTNYIKGMYKFINEEGYETPYGLDILVSGNIPNGAGLSSSASLELLAGVTIAGIYDLDIDRLTLIKLGQKVENEFLGLNTGIMDQFAIGMGKKDHALYLDVNTLNYEYVPAEFGDYVILIMNTNKRRELTDSKYNQRRSECEVALAILKDHADITNLCDLTNEEFAELGKYLEDEILYKRAKHAVTENTRTKEANRVLNQGNLEAFGKLMNQSHISLRDNYDVTGIELDTLVQAAWNQDEVLGARMTGAGMGGCAIALVHKDQVESVKKNIQASYTETIGYAPSFYVAEVGDGAKQIQ